MHKIDDALQQTTVPPSNQRHLKTLLRGLGTTIHQVSPEVKELVEHRLHKMKVHTANLASFSHEHQESAPTSTAMPQQQEGKSTIWQTLKTAGQSLRRRRVPVLIQMCAVECGAACLAMILSYYGRKTSISEIREHCGVGRDGLSALNIVQAARTYGLRVRALSLQENDFRFVSMPTIIHWEFNHFMIVERWSPQGVDVVDPALGRRHLTAEEFDAGFTGIVITLEPGVNFAQNSTSAHTSINLRAYALSYVKQAPMSFVQIIGASLLLQLFGLVVPILTAVVVDQVIPFGMKDVLSLLGIGLLILVIAQFVMLLLRAMALLYLQTRVDLHMMLGFFERLLTLSLGFFQQRSSGDILARLNSNIVIRDTISNQLVSTVLDGSLVMVYLLILLWLSPTFGLLVLAIGLLQVLLLVSTGHVIRNLARRELVAQGKSNGYIAEALAGIATIKAAGAEDRALGQWSNLFFDQMNSSVRRNYLSSLIDTTMSTLRAFSPLVLLMVGTMQVLNGSLQVGTMLALNALAIAFLTPLASLMSGGQKLQVVHSHLERIADVMEAEPEQDIQAVAQPPKLTGQIKLENVSFQYDPHSPKVLHDISVSIAPGQKVAIVGRSGAGKSTLGNLLLGMYLPTTGEILYDEKPLRAMDYRAVRAQFGVVMQESSIFSGSIRENIAFNDRSIAMERIIKAAQATAIHDDIMRMPMEYETFVSEGGSALSGGQRQRLALARALITSPVILLLDESTSALDVVTEKVVEQNLGSLACTQIIIAHRLSTVRNADQILVIDQGTIVERGTHDELLTCGGFYAKLIKSQLVPEENQERVSSQE